MNNKVLIIICTVLTFSACQPSNGEKTAADQQQTENKNTGQEKQTPKKKSFVVPSRIESFKPDSVTARDRFYKSSMLNDQGLELYKQKQYNEAAKLFRQAIWEESTYLYPHYNLACMLALQYEADGNRLQKELESELRVCSGLDTTRLGLSADWFQQRLKEDSDFNEVREKDWFKAIQKRTNLYPPTPRERFMGDWKNLYNSAYNLSLNSDGTYLLNLDSRSFRGSWDYSNEKGVVIKTDNAGSFPLKSIITDTFLHTLRLNIKENGERKELLFIEPKADLLMAAADNDKSLTAWLLAADHVPQGYNGYKEDLIKLAVSRQDIVLLRLLLGKHGYRINNDFYIHRDEGYELETIELMRKRQYKELAEESRRIPVQMGYNWYKKMFETPGLAASYSGGSSVDHSLLALNSSHILLFTRVFVSAMPGNEYYYSVFNVQRNSMSESIHIGGTPMIWETRPYSNMEGKEAYVRMFMDREKELLKLIDLYDFDLTRPIPKIIPFPCTYKGKQYEFRKEQSQDLTLDQEIHTEPGTQSFTIYQNGELLFSSKDYDYTWEINPIGLIPLDDSDFFLLIAEAKCWGFEGEVDTVIILESVYMYREI